MNSLCLYQQWYYIYGMVNINIGAIQDSCLDYSLFFNDITHVWNFSESILQVGHASTVNSEPNRININDRAKVDF